MMGPRSASKGRPSSLAQWAGIVALAAGVAALGLAAAGRRVAPLLAGPPRPSTWLDWLLSLRVAGKPLFHSEAALAFAWSLVAIIALVILSTAGTRRLSMKPRGLQTLLETVVGGLRSLVEGVMGPRGVEFVPFIGTLFIYIALMNLMGLVPGFMAPTSNLSITAALAVVVFVVVQYQGFRERGMGYPKHFVEGVPLRAVYLPLAALVFVIHVIGEIFRPVTLALRLRGNIMAGETVVIILVGLGAVLMAKVKVPVPLQLPNLLLEVLVGFVQATIFCMLTAVYLSGVLKEEAAAGD